MDEDITREDHNFELLNKILIEARRYFVCNPDYKYQNEARVKLVLEPLQIEGNLLLGTKPDHIINGKPLTGDAYEIFDSYTPRKVAHGGVVAHTGDPLQEKIFYIIDHIDKKKINRRDNVNSPAATGQTRNVILNLSRINKELNDLKFGAILKKLNRLFHTLNHIPNISTVLVITGEITEKSVRQLLDNLLPVHKNNRYSSIIRNLFDLSYWTKKIMPKQVNFINLPDSLRIPIKEDQTYIDICKEY